MCSHASKDSSRKEETRRHQKSEEEEEEEERTGTGGGMNLNPSTSMVGDADGGRGCAGVIEDGGELGDPMSFLDDPFPAVNATAQ